MLVYKWALSASQPENEVRFMDLQYALYERSILINTSVEEGSPYITLYVDETSSVSSRKKVNDNTACKRGRKPKSPRNDLTLGQVRHMRFMEMPMKDIAFEIGISKRTLYRRLEQINGLNLPEDTPFSKWLES